MTPFEKINLVRNFQGLSMTQKLVLLVIATHLGDNDFCYLSYTTLQKECSIKKRTTISETLNSLIEEGFLIKKEPDKGFKSNRYWIVFDQLISHDSTQNKQKLSTDQSPTVTSDLQLLVTDGYQTSNRRLLDQSPSVTSLVTDGYPKEQLNNLKRNLKKSSYAKSSKKAQKAENAKRHNFAQSMDQVANARKHERENNKTKFDRMPKNIHETCSMQVVEDTMTTIKKKLAEKMTKRE